MKILFFSRHYSYLRLFEAPLTALAERGHQIHLAADREEAMGGRGLAERLAARYPGITLGATPGRAGGIWTEIARRVRLGIDYLRYLAPEYAAMPTLRGRARDRAPRAVVLIADRLSSPGMRRLLARTLRALERGLPSSSQLEAFIREQRPDVVLITPLVELGSPQMEHMIAARNAGVRTVLPVASWDHLSSKALIRQLPERVLVWNDVQRREAVDMHGVPAERVTVTGAQCYDQWFGRAPARDRERFCARVGLRADRPYILYVGSSLFKGTVSEAAFVEQWLAAVRSSPDPRLRDIGILLRPHPQRLDEWKTVDVSGYRDVAFWGSMPVDTESKDDYFDSLYHSAAVVGLTTSAFLEAAVVGKPVHTVLFEDISRSNQEGTIHFSYLLNVNGGLLYTARSFEEHLANLAGTLTVEGERDPRATRFVESFIRPFGRDVPATPKFVEAVEAVGALGPAPRDGGRWLDPLFRLPLYPLAASLGLLLKTQPLRKETRRRLRKTYQDSRRRVFVKLKQFSQAQLGDKELVVAPAEPSMLTPKPGAMRDPAKKAVGWDLPVASATREQIAALGRSGEPIIIGPWLSETGFELLYWIPFLAWAKSHGNLDPEQLMVVSRGGAASWYRHITTRYEDVFSFFTPDEFRQRNDARIAEQQGRLKHVGISRFDEEIIRRVSEKHGLRGAQVLHPSMMYELFDPFWFQRVSLPFVEMFTSFAPLQAPDLGDLRAHLPQRYVAAKFYGNVALPESGENRAFVSNYLQALTEHVDVVLLNTGHRYDDHEDMPRVARERLHTVEHLMTPATNLDVQTRIIGGAQAFVGTYGGFSYLAPFCGIDTLAFYSHVTGFRYDHLEVAKRVFSALRRGTFVELDTKAADLLRLGFGSPVPHASDGTRAANVTLVP